MSNYRESAVSGIEWIRCGAVQITNPYQIVPAVTFVEERVLSIVGNDPIFSSAGSITVPFDAAKVIPLINPETGAPTGASVTYGEAYAILFSAYIAAALERDAAEAAAALGGGE